MGRDKMRLVVQIIHVSIHAPAWGATVLDAVLERHQIASFNPRARMGATRCAMTLSQSACFNPRARMGRDERPATLTAGTCFNPRARTGRDNRLQRAIAELVSIHAPAWGATEVEPAI